MDSERLEEITIADLETHAAKHGQKATSKVLSLLGQRKPLYDIVMSPGGQLLFAKHLNRMNELLDKLVNGKVTESQRLEYKIRLEFLQSSVKILKNYKRYKSVLKGGQ